MQGRRLAFAVPPGLTLARPLIARNEGKRQRCSRRRLMGFGHVLPYARLSAVGALSAVRARTMGPVVAD